MRSSEACIQGIQDSGGGNVRQVVVANSSVCVGKASNMCRRLLRVFAMLQFDCKVSRLRIERKIVIRIYEKF